MDSGQGGLFLQPRLLESIIPPEDNDLPRLCELRHDSERGVCVKNELTCRLHHRVKDIDLQGRLKSESLQQFSPELISLTARFVASIPFLSSIGSRRKKS